MRGKVDVERLAEGGDLQKGGHAAAAGHIGLLHVDRLRLQHLANIIHGVGIFAGGDLHAGRGPPPRRPQSRQIVGTDRLLEPAHPLFGELIGEFERLLDAIGAVGIDEQCRRGRRSPAWPL